MDGLGVSGMTAAAEDVFRFFCFFSMNSGVATTLGGGRGAVAGNTVATLPAPPWGVGTTLPEFPSPTTPVATAATELEAQSPAAAGAGVETIVARFAFCCS